jgi:hypothetical protein
MLLKGINMNYCVKYFSKGFLSNLKQYIASGIALLFISTGLYSQRIWADPVIQPKNLSLSSGVILKGSAIKGNFVSDDKKINKSLPSQGASIHLENSNLESGNLDSGKIDVTNSSVSITDAVLSDAVITNTKIEYTEGASSVHAAGTFSEASINGAEIQNTSIKPRTSTTSKEFPSDQYSWSGDTITFHVDFPKVMDASGNIYCAPDYSEFVVGNEDKNTHQLSGRFDVIGKSKVNLLFKHVGEERLKCEHGNPVKEHTTYFIDKSEVEKIINSRSGFTFGVLLVPFKFHTVDKSITGSTTIGPYIGYRSANFGSFSGTTAGILNGTSTTFVLSVGWVDNISVPTAPGVNPPGTVDRSGVSMAIGVIFSVDKGSGTQVGLLVGQDRLGSNAIAPYKYEGQTWVSFAIGYKFF